jgi:predicted CXXCH cytochrome family protein
MQEKSQWLALAIPLFIVTSILSMTLLWPPGSQAFNHSSSPFLQKSGNYQSPYHCRECHEAEFQAWSGTTHADASFDPIFQVYLEQVRKPGECFSCHATGYDSATGQFVLAGVTCEACHGPYRPEHPEESLIAAASEALCGTCHAGTFAEWTTSHHYEAGVTCSDCHEVHTQKTRAADNTNLLCAGCHQDQIQDGTHAIHNPSETSIHCIDCHLARPSDDAGAMVKGQVATGHSFAVFLRTCRDCHPLPMPPDAEGP